MKKIIGFAGIFLLLLSIINISEVRANACFLATEDGSSDDCDSGTAKAGLPVHGTNTISKKGTSGLCNNVNSFSDKEQAQEYAKSHEYDDVYAEGGCWKPKCNNYSDCTSGLNTCCKSLVNNECWHVCDVCKFNNIKGTYFPYADQTIEGCELVGKNGLDYHTALYTDDNLQKGFKISSIRNTEPLGAWNTDVWKCDAKSFNAAIKECVSKATEAPIVRGYKENLPLKSLTANQYKTSFICVDGKKSQLIYDTRESEVNNSLVSNMANKYGCPLSAVKCNNSKGYYNDADTCQGNDPHLNFCSVVKSEKKYGDRECWHRASKCHDFSYGDYWYGNYNSLNCNSDQNTEKKYYCPKDVALADCGESNAVELDGYKCGRCECKSGYTRISSCNDPIQDILLGYYQAEYACEIWGYTLSPTEVSGKDCQACPYNAMFWSCD